MEGEGSVLKSRWEWAVQLLTTVKDIIRPESHYTRNLGRRGTKTCLVMLGGGEGSFLWVLGGSRIGACRKQFSGSHCFSSVVTAVLEIRLWPRDEVLLQSSVG